LPSLLRYVDHDLIRDTSLHNKPPTPDAMCRICGHQHNLAPISTTFLPLTPCGCWIHYRCFIWWVTRVTETRASCPICGIKLAEWDGIGALTLATRTGFDMQDVQFAPYACYTDVDTQFVVNSDSTEYICECQLIEQLIGKHFFHQLHLAQQSQPPKYTDRSPDLTQCYYNVLDELDKMRRPRAKWLRWNTSSGFFLFGMLVAIKMRRWLVQEHGRIVQTDGWKYFIAGWDVLQEKLLEEV
ncbi:hypothetical protein BU26DRAFT_388838, partial [Trematosphaeria pertusa]